MYIEFNVFETGFETLCNVFEKVFSKRFKNV